MRLTETRDCKAIKEGDRAFSWKLRAVLPSSTWAEDDEEEDVCVVSVRETCVNRSRRGGLAAHGQPAAGTGGRSCHSGLLGGRAEDEFRERS